MKYVPELHHDLGTFHLLSMDQAALWAGMGLGKTGMTLSAISKLFEQGKTKGVLIIAPLRVGVLTWPNELRKWDEFKHLKAVHVMTESGWSVMERGLAHIYIINWDQIAFLAEHFLRNKRATELPFDTVIFDETTRAKNPESKRVNKFRAYINKFKRRWGLTGTPAPNSLLELFAQIRLLDDGKCLGQSFASYRDCYFELVNPFDRFKSDYKLRPGAEQKIYEKVSDIALVLKSSDWLDLPDTVITDIEVALPDIAKRFYKELADNLIAISGDEKVVDAINLGVLANKLLQVSGGEVYLTQEYDENQKPKTRETTVIHDAKIKALEKLFKQLGSRPCILACVFRHEQDRLIRRFPHAVRFDSAQSASSQQRLEADWNSGKIELLITDPRSIGHGLNLQDGGHTIIWYSYTWSREYYDQLNARLARPGQKNVPEIYRLLSPGTMDDAVIAVLETRGNNQNSLLDAVLYFRALYLLGKRF